MPEKFLEQENNQEQLKYFAVEITYAPGWPRIEKLYIGKSKEQVLKTARAENERENEGRTQNDKYQIHEISRDQYFHLKALEKYRQDKRKKGE